MKSVKTTLALVIVTTLSMGGCATTNSDQTRSKEEKRAEFQTSVRDYLRMQHDQKMVEQRSSFVNTSMEAVGIPTAPRDGSKQP